MKLAVFGGSFNPVHTGHLFIAEEVCCTLNYDMIIFVPAKAPPHKDLAPGASDKKRLKMLELAVEANDCFAVDDIEIRRGGTSYTIETIEYVCDRYKTSEKPGLIIGDDLIEGFKSWKNADKLLTMVDLIVVHRESEKRKKFPEKHLYVDNSPLPVSSSNIRKRVASGRAFRYLVPDNVYRFICENSLYKTADSHTPA